MSRRDEICGSAACGDYRVPLTVGALTAAAALLAGWLAMEIHTKGP